SRQTSQLGEGHLQTLQPFVERDGGAGPSGPHTVQVTRERRVIAGWVATRPTRLEYAEVLLWLDQKPIMTRTVRDTYLDACMIPGDQIEQWVARTSPVVHRALVERLTLEESGDRSVLMDAKLTRWLGVQWARTDVMMSPFYKVLKAKMEEYKGP
ncbi:hypothetical protein BDR03DRAFT_960587, partial [Suillus americanus]